MTLEDEIAEQFVAARRAGKSLAGYPGAVPATLAEGYRIQDAAIARVSDRIQGWKVGRIFPPQSTEVGADRLSGPIFAASVQNVSQCAATLPVGRIHQGGFGAAEAEYLLRIGAAPALHQRSFTLAQAADLVDAVHVGIEIASSPLAAINDLGPGVTVSDFGNNNGLIVGPAITDWRTTEFAHWPVSLLIDGEVVGNGSAAGFPDGPVGSVRFLLEHLAARGIALPAGSWVSSGAITGVHAVRPGQRVEATFGASNHPKLSVACQIDFVQDKT